LEEKNVLLKYGLLPNTHVSFSLIKTTNERTVGRVRMIEFAVAQQMKLQDMLHNLAARLEREEGQDMIEYALLAALISIVAIAIIILIGPYLVNLFQDVVNALGTT
jgi:pilus assembly protein Flp/PilA